MLDIRLIRDDPAAFDAAMARRGKPADAATILDLDRRRREVFVFFDNTDKRHAPEDARRLMEMLGLRWEAGDEAAG